MRLLDPIDSEHLQTMINSPLVPYFRSGDKIEVNSSALASTVGLQTTSLSNAHSINILRSKRQPYRRRDGLIGEFLLTDPRINLSQEEMDSVKLALNGKRKEEDEINLKCDEVLLPSDEDAQVAPSPKRSVIELLDRWHAMKKNSTFKQT